MKLYPLASIAIVLGVFVTGCSLEECTEAITTLANCEATSDPTVCDLQSEAVNTAFSLQCTMDKEKSDIFSTQPEDASCSWDWQCNYDSGFLCLSGTCSHLPIDDRCDLPSEEYNSLSGRQKQAALMALHVDSEPTAVNDFNGALLALHRVADFVIPKFGAEKITDSMTQTCDVLPEPSIKQVHALGSLASADWIIEDSQYSGLFEQGSIPALIRFSIANPVLGVSLPSFIPNLEFIPGISIKLLVDGRESGNIVAMDSLAGQGSDRNFFLNPFYNDFSHNAPTSEFPASKARYANNVINHEVMKTVGIRFQETLHLIGDDSTTPFHRPVHSLAEYRGDGSAVVDPNSPDYLVFRATADINDNSTVVDSTTEIDFREKLSAIQNGTPIFDIFAVEDGIENKIGYIKITSVPTPSLWADRQFFVQHTR
ncbi:hypothetical protein A9Q99_23645 [Gammaproteobacteria bacterium 45_16_T64]|nr:hypothetical protein A9Q99_23645 [Gammaproteobacteria bacterium 45_16_T64]